VVTRTRYASVPFDCAPKASRFFKTAFAAGVGIVAFVALILLFVSVIGAATAPPGAPAPWWIAVLPLAIYAVVLPPLIAYTTSRNVNEVFRTTTLGPHRFSSDLSATRLTLLYLGNIAGIVLTLGLYTPWAQIRTAKYRLETLTVLPAGSLDDFVAGARASTPAATGEEIADLFDVDFGL
jgi:uncharacterized membrane protein YjgN (DUF898 family)